MRRVGYKWQVWGIEKPEHMWKGRKLTVYWFSSKDVLICTISKSKFPFPFYSFISKKMNCLSTIALDCSLILSLCNQMVNSLCLAHSLYSLLTFFSPLPRIFYFRISSAFKLFFCQNTFQDSLRLKSYLPFPTFSKASLYIIMIWQIYIYSDCYS